MRPSDAAPAGYFALPARSVERSSLRRSVDFNPNEAIPSEMQRNPISAKTPIITTVTMSPAPSTTMVIVHA